MPALRISVGFVVNPLMNGFRYSSSRLPLSAPSAKFLTRRLPRLGIGLPLQSSRGRQVRLPQDDPHCLFHVAIDRVRLTPPLVLPRLRVLAQDRAAPSRPPTFD